MRGFDENQRDDVDRVQATLLRDVPKEKLLKDKVKDKVVMKPAVDYPHCVACDWRYGEVLGKSL